MTRKKIQPPSSLSSQTETILEKLGINREDVLAESTEEVLSAKMVVAGFIDQTMFFLENLKKTILTSPGGLDLQTTGVILTSCIQMLEHTERALTKYAFIRTASRQITKLKLAKASNADNDPHGDFYSHEDSSEESPNPENDRQEGEEEEEEDIDLVEEQSSLPADAKKKLN
jgi:NACalpha-BTF3-like transcription factor